MSIHAHVTADNATEQECHRLRQSAEAMQSYTALQSQQAVTAHSESERLPPVGFAQIPAPRRITTARGAPDKSVRRDLHLRVNLVSADIPEKYSSAALS